MTQQELVTKLQELYRVRFRATGGDNMVMVQRLRPTYKLPLELRIMVREREYPTIRLEDINEYRLQFSLSKWEQILTGEQQTATSVLQAATSRLRYDGSGTIPSIRWSEPSQLSEENAIMGAEEIVKQLARQYGIPFRWSSSYPNKLTISRRNYASDLPFELVAIILAVCHADESTPEYLSPNNRSYTRSEWVAIIEAGDILLDQPRPTGSWLCADCEEIHTYGEDDQINVGNGNNHLVCENCLENYYHCAGGSCNRWIDSNNDEYTSTYNNTYCESCASDYTFYCEGCEEDYDNDPYTLDDSTYCESCYSDRTTYCNRCEQSVASDSTTYCEECGNDYCEECWSSDEHNEENLTPAQREERQRAREEARERRIMEERMSNPYRKPSTEFFAGKAEEAEHVKVDRFVGVEIEAERGDTYGLGVEVPEQVGISTDGSLRDRGVELQTPPASTSELERFVNKTCEALVKKGYKGTRNAGLHVHIDARDIRSNHTKITQVIKTFYAVEDILYSMLPPSRWQSNYCKRLAQDYLYKNFRQQSDVKGIEKAWYRTTNDDECDNRRTHKYDNARYYGLNIHSLFYRGTIELRYHSGTVNANKILNWVNLTTRLVDYAITSYTEEDVQKLFDMETGGYKLKFMLDLIKAPYSLERYIMQRVGKFNPNFAVKFNKGKKERSKEQAVITRRKNKLEKTVIKCKEQLEPTLRRRYRELGFSFSNQEFARSLENEALSMALRELNYPSQEVEKEGGFISNEEINRIQTFINQGRQLQRESSSTDTTQVDFEE